jgi:hypothetical protein
MCLLKNSVIIEIIKNTILINQELVNKLNKRELKVTLLMIMGETSGSISKKLMIKPNIVLHIKNRYKFIYTYFLCFQGVSLMVENKLKLYQT